MSPLLATASHQAFWASSSATALVVGACALIVGVAVALTLRRRSSRGSVRERIGAFLAPVGVEQDVPINTEPPGAGLMSRTERTLERERFWDDFKEKLDIARIERPAIEIVYLTVAFSLAGAVLLAVMTGTPYGGLPALVLVPLLARAFINQRLKHQRNLFGEQLPAHLQELAAAMRAGHSMISGMAVMAEGANEPTQGEFQRVMADEALGMELDEAIRNVVVRMDAQDMEQVSLVAELNRRTGGNMAEVLDRVAEAVRERAELNRELRTLTAQARGSRWIVTMIPPGLLLAIEVLNPSYLNVLFKTSTGNVLLVASVGLIIFGSLVMGRIVRIEA
jgi:tight adherence protein B